MLVLSRKSGQRILIGDRVVVTVLAIQGGNVRLGVDAPRKIVVRRSELPIIRSPAPAIDTDVPVIISL